MIKPHAPRWLKILAAVYATYLALILIAGTPLLNIFAPKLYREQTGAELKLEKIIWLNPFTLSAMIRQVSSTNFDQSPFWAFDELGVNISLASLWRGHLVLDALTLRGVDVQIQQTAAERFNFTDILDYRAKHFPVPTEATPSPQSNSPFIIDIAKFELTAKHLSYHAPHATEPLNAVLEDFAFTLTNFSTASDTEKNTAEKIITIPSLKGSNLLVDIKTLNIDFLREQYSFKTGLRNFKIAIPALSTTSTNAQNYTFSVLDMSGGSIEIKGNAAFAQNNATGSAQIRGLNLLPAWQYLADKLAFEAKNALLDGDVNFRVNWSNQFAYQVSDSQLALRDVKLQSRADADTNVEFNALRVKGIDIDSVQPQLHIAHMTLGKPVLRGWNRDTKVSLLDMIAFPANDEPSPPSPWQVIVDAIDVEDGSVHWRASQLDNRQLTIAPLAISATNLHWPDPASLQFNASTIINDDANNTTAADDIKVTIDGELIPGDITGKINGAITNLPLTWGNSFLQQQIHATIADGALNTKFSIVLDKAQPTLAQSEGTIDHFELQMQSPSQQSASDRRKLVTWKKLQWQQLAIEPSKPRINVKKIIVTQPWAQFRINADGTNNFQQLLVNSETAKPKHNAESTAKNGAKPVRTTEQESKNNSEKPWQLIVDNIQIDHAAIDFRDTSLTSAFRTNITDLSGDISNIDTSARQSKNGAAKVALKGTVDGYAPVAISGTVNPFTLQPQLNITLDITNIDLAALTPYSGTYAGYQIDSGRLSVQMAYTLENGRIKGSNHIVVNQMQLGKQVSGPKVMELPLRLAIYLLTDSNGVMDLGVDVTGDVDDPDFSVGSIIWKALRNLIVKTVASPFKALARLGGSDRDDLDHIEFQIGSSQFAPGENEKLESIQHGLEKKTALKLNIMGHVSPSRDLEALRDNTLSAQLIAQGGVKPTDIQQQSKNWQLGVIKLFKQRFPDDASALQVMQMNDAMRDNIELPPSALPDLAAERALALKQALVTEHGLAADRAFVKPTDLGADKTPGPFATLTVE